MLVIEAVSKDKRHQTPHSWARPRQGRRSSAWRQRADTRSHLPCVFPWYMRVHTRVCGPVQPLHGGGVCVHRTAKAAECRDPSGSSPAPSSPPGCSPVCSCVLRAGRAPQHLWGQVSPPGGLVYHRPLPPLAQRLWSPVSRGRTRWSVPVWAAVDGPLLNSRARAPGEPHAHTFKEQKVPPEPPSG